MPSCPTVRDEPTEYPSYRTYPKNTVPERREKLVDEVLDYFWDYLLHYYSHFRNWEHCGNKQCKFHEPLEIFKLLARSMHEIIRRHLDVPSEDRSPQLQHTDDTKYIHAQLKVVLNWFFRTYVTPGSDAAAHIGKLMQNFDEYRRRHSKSQYRSGTVTQFGDQLMRHIECVFDAEKLNVELSSLLVLPTIDEFCVNKKGFANVDVANIAPKDNKCAICWSPYFEVEDELDPKPMALPNELPRASEKIRWNNAPVKMRCGHIFGHGCILKSVMSGDLMCPLRCGYLCHDVLMESGDSRILLAPIATVKLVVGIII